MFRTVPEHLTLLTSFIMLSYSKLQATQRRSFRFKPQTTLYPACVTAFIWPLGQTESTQCETHYCDVCSQFIKTCTLFSVKDETEEPQ